MHPSQKGMQTSCPKYAKFCNFSVAKLDGVIQTHEIEEFMYSAPGLRIGRLRA